MQFHQAPSEARKKRVATSNGQVSQEFMLIIVAELLLFTLFVSVYLSQLNYTHSTRDRLQVEQTAYKIAQAINYAYLAGDGTDYNLSIASSRSTITIAERFITAENNESGAFFQAYILANMTPTTINNTGTLYITNRRGVIEIK